MTKRKHVLLVDDEPDFRFSATVALKRAGYEVSEAEDGLEALLKIVEARDTGEMYSMLLTDIRMPVMSGLTLLDALHRLRIRLPVITISNSGDEAMFEELAGKGCTEHMQKPFNPAELVTRIDTFLGGASEEASPERHTFRRGSNH